MARTMKLSALAAAEALLLSTALAAQDAAATASPTYSYGVFSYTQVTSNRYATPLPSPLAFPTPFAPAFSEASTLLPSNVTYTTWSLDRDATTLADGAYGQSAYASMWAPYSYSNTVPFTTTASPTPVASSELVFPPPLYNAPAIAAGRKFPSDFMWGMAGSAWQIEGGLHHEGRGPGGLDMIGALGVAGTSSDSVVADMNYYLYKQDIARLAAMGVPHYSFSIAWSRVVPFGKAGTPVNQQALDHYEDLVATCLEYGVTPIVTLNHADIPAAGVNSSGDITEFVDDFMYYAKEVTTRLADRVPMWFTFNEPNIAPLYMGSTWNSMTAVLTAHATFYHWYKDELKGTGRISTKFANNLAIPLRGPDNADDVAACNRYQDILLGIMANPLFLGQQYPAAALDTPGMKMTPLTDAQLDFINGTVDFWAFDPYVAQFVTPPSLTSGPESVAACSVNASDPLFPTCVAFSTVQENGWLMGAYSNAYSYVSPQYVRQQLLYVWDTFRPSGIMVSEFGLPVYGESSLGNDLQRYDLVRTLYYQDFLAETLKAVYEDGVNVIGALAWSFADNNEFGSYDNQYGLQTVNRTNGLLTRSFKRSFFDYVDFFKTHIACK
jgi:beta-glucosidase/6-phospho-beta-glucosidase/beta-galactosidase